MNERQLAGKVGAVVDLERVSLRSVEAHLPDPALLNGQLELDVSWETSVERPAPNLFRYRYRLALSTSSAHDLHIECDYELDYRVPDGTDVEEDALVAFGEVSAAFSAFPYARELVQSLTTRASLPPLILGTLRAPIDPPRSPADISGEDSDAMDPASR